MLEALGHTLVLGANGNVGRLLMSVLAGLGIPVSGSLRPGREPPAGPADARWMEIELSDPSSLGKALAASDSAGVETVVWTPSVGLVPDCIPVMETARLRRVLILSSASVHTRLDSGGARMKRGSEELIRNSGLSWTIIRPTMIYGNDRDRNITRLLDYLERFPVFPLFGDGSGLMQPVFIDDLVQAILRACALPQAVGRAYDLGGGSPLSYRCLVETAAATLNRRVRFVSIPAGLAAWSIRCANKIGFRFLREEQIHRLAEDKVVDSGPVISDLALRPRSFAAGVELQVERRREKQPGNAKNG